MTRLKQLLLRARGHRIETVSGQAMLPDGCVIHLANAPLVTDKETGVQSVRWGTTVWPVLDRETLALGAPGEDL